MSFSQSQDPLLYREPLSLEGKFWPLGCPVRVLTNSPLVLAAAEASWRESTPRLDVPPVVIRAGIHGKDGFPAPPAPVFRSHEHLLTIVATPYDTAVCDLRAGLSYSWVTPAAIADTAYYRYMFLEAMAYLPIAALYLAPIHAAAVAWNGKGVLLCGDSGDGKSSLAFACARRGWTYVCDDSAYMVRGKQEPRIIGSCHSVRLREEAKALFPEIEQYLPTRRPTGSVRLEIRTADLKDFRTAGEADISHVLFLDRQAGANPAMTPMSRDEAYAQFTKTQNYGPAEMHAAWNATYQDLLASANLARFTYSSFDPAIDRLEQLIRHGGL